MLARIATWIFYAIVFFALGAWTNKHFSDVGEAVDWTLDATAGGARSAYHWAFGDEQGSAEKVKTATPAAKDGEASPAKVAETPASSPSDAKEEDARLKEARSVYSTGNINKAIEIYLAMLEDDPENLDLRGELGNVYYSSGRLVEAATAYYSVATGLIGQGEKEKARMLEPAIRRGNKELADALSLKLAGSD